jgi:hypothetical protein
MLQKCSHCQKDLTPQEWARDESEAMEAERHEQGVEGMRFRYYTCSACGRASIFVDVYPLAGESDEEFHRRWDVLEAAVQPPQDDGTAVLLVEWESPPSAAV